MAHYLIGFCTRNKQHELMIISQVGTDAAYLVVTFFLLWHRQSVGFIHFNRKISAECVNSQFTEYYSIFFVYIVSDTFFFFVSCKKKKTDETPSECNFRERNMYFTFIHF